jgi:hemerythrin-like domain-containing protein
MNMSARTIEQEHAALRPQLDRIREVADEVGEASLTQLRRDLAALHDFLAHTVMPHAVAEGRVLFPLVRRESGEATIGVRMTECHVQLGRLIDELEAAMGSLDAGAVSANVERELRRVLYGTHTVLSAHLAEADSEVQPLLEAKLSPEEREELFEAIERCAREVADLFE